VNKTVKIRVSIETRTALNALKRGGESQDAVIRRLISDHVTPILDELAAWMRPIIDPILEATPEEAAA